MSGTTPNMFEEIIHALNTPQPAISERWKTTSIDLGNALTLVPDFNRQVYVLQGRDGPGRPEYARQEAERAFGIRLTLHKDNEGNLGCADMRHVQQALAHKLGFQPPR